MSITLSQLRTQARERADMVDSEFVSNSELNNYINSSIAELHDLLIQSYGSEYYVKTTTFQTVANTDNYSLPSDFYKLHGVDAKLNGNDYLPIKKFNFNERNRFNEITSWNLYGTPSVRYRIIGSKIFFTPVPTSVVDVKLWYTPLATKLSADGDTLDDINQFAEYVIVDAAIKMLQKEESDVSVLMAQKQLLTQRITNAAQNRDAGEPEAVSDVYADIDDYYRRS